jgi:c-di-GMP-binding flagellar brake protein YcgR
MRLGVGARLGGAPVSFEGVAVEIGTESNVAFYKLPIPDAIDHVEQRGDLRVRVAFAYNIPVYVWADVDNPYRGKLYDLSSKGVGIRLGRAAEAALTSGKSDFTCMIQFPDGETVRTALEVCAVSPRKQQPHIKVGGRLIDLSEKDQRIIDRFIAAADRAQVKKLQR